MNRIVFIVAVVAVVVGALAGYLWWGLPTTSLQNELRDVRVKADRLDQQLAELRADQQRLEGQLKAAQSRLEASEQELRGEKEMNARLQMLVSRGKK
jgi:uncharacterized protein HemX